MRFGGNGLSRRGVGFFKRMRKEGEGRVEAVPDVVCVL